MGLNKVEEEVREGKGMEERHEAENLGEAWWSFSTNFLVVLPDTVNKNIGGQVTSAFKIDDWYSFNTGMTHTCVMTLKDIYYLFEIKI